MVSVLDPRRFKPADKTQGPSRWQSAILQLLFRVWTFIRLRKTGCLQIVDLKWMIFSSHGISRRTDGLTWFISVIWLVPLPITSGKASTNKLTSSYPALLCFLTWPAHNLTHDRNLAPSGWIEQLEPCIQARCDDGTLNPDGEFASWHKVVPGSIGTTGKNFDTEAHMRAHMEAAGFTNVHEKLYKIPLGDWAKHPILKEAGKFNKIHLMEGLEGVSYVQPGM